MKITEKRINRGYLFRACYVISSSLVFGKNSRQAEGWESFIVKEKVKASGVLWLEAVGKLEVSYLDAGHIMWLVWRAYLTFSVQSWFESNGKNRKIGSHWPSPDTSGPEVFAEMWFGFQGFQIRVLLSCMVWSSSACMFSTLTGEMWMIVHWFSLIQYLHKFTCLWIYCPKYIVVLKYMKNTNCYGSLSRGRKKKK